MRKQSRDGTPSGAPTSVPSPRTVGSHGSQSSKNLGLVALAGQCLHGPSSRSPPASRNASSERWRPASASASTAAERRHRSAARRTAAARQRRSDEVAFRRPRARSRSSPCRDSPTSQSSQPSWKIASGIVLNLQRVQSGRCPYEHVRARRSSHGHQVVGPRPERPDARVPGASRAAPARLVAAAGQAERR